MIDFTAITIAMTGCASWGGVLGAALYLALGGSF